MHYRSKTYNIILFNYIILFDAYYLIIICSGLFLFDSFLGGFKDIKVCIIVLKDKIFNYIILFDAYYLIIICSGLFLFDSFLDGFEDI